MALNLNCPSCASDNTQRLSVIYEHGMSDVNTSSNTAGLGIGRGGLGVGLAKTKTKGTSQTAMSQKASPPPKKPFLKPLGLIFVAYLVLIIFAGNSKIFGGLVGLLWLGGSTAWIAFAIKYNTKEWPQLKSTWDDSFLCNRCNQMFHVG